MAYSGEYHDKHRNGVPPAQQVDPTDEHMSIGRYIATRIPSLKPPMTKAPNPITLLRMLTFQQWMFFLVGPLCSIELSQSTDAFQVAFLGWTWDAFDFFTVSLTVTPLAKQFGKTNTDITYVRSLSMRLEKQLSRG